MEFLNERLQFLDLSNANEIEQSLIEQILFTGQKPLEVPWCTSDKSEECKQPNVHYVDNGNQNIDSKSNYQQREAVGLLKDANNARNQPTQTEEIYHLSNPVSHIQVYPMVPSLPGVFVPSVTTTSLVHSSYVSAPRIAPDRYAVVDEIPSAQEFERPVNCRVGDDVLKEENPDSLRIKKQKSSSVEANVNRSPDHYQGQPPPSHFQTLPAGMQPYYLQGTPGTSLYMQPVFSIYSPPHIFNPYGPSAAPSVYQQTDLNSATENNMAVAEDFGPNQRVLPAGSYEETKGNFESFNAPILENEVITEVSKEPVVSDTESKNVELNESSDLAECRLKHEHLCYHTEVVVKLPKKKNLNESQNTGDGVNEEAKFVSAENQRKTNFKYKNSEPQVVNRGETEDQPQDVKGKSWASLFDSDKVRPMARVSPRVKTELPSLSVSKISSEAGASSFADTYLRRLGKFLYFYEPDHKIVSVQPRGLTNRNNWCYVNAILQSLIACPPFYNLMKALPVEPQKRYPETLMIDNMIDFLREFSPANARIGKREKSARNREETNVEIFTGPAFEPLGIYKILDKLRGENCFDIEGRQEDAEEFLSCLLNGLNDEMFELIKLSKGKDEEPTMAAGGEELDAAAVAEAAEWNVMGPKNKSSVTRRAVCGKTPLSDIFRGQVRSRVLKGDQPPTDNVQPFFTLQLDIEKTNSVKEALELLAGKDQLEGVTCSKTHREVEAWTQTTLEDLPVVLILHLKCFLYKTDGCSKIIKNFDFPIDLKIDPKLMSANRKNKYTSKQRNYKLISVVYHDGKEATKGHYVTDAYHVGYGCWIRYDDGAVRSVPESYVLKPRAPRVPYLLYYRRGDTISSGGPTK